MNDTGGGGDRPSRRAVLRAVAGGGAVALAGCSITTSDDGIEVDLGGDDGTPTDADPPTGTTDTPTDVDPATVTTDTPTAYPAPSFDEDCLPQEPEAVEIVEDGDQWLLTDGDSRMLLFEEFEQAKRARDVIQHYGFTRWCFLGRPDPSMQYWLVDGGPPVRGEPAVETEDCIPVDRSTLSVERYGDGDWRLTTDDQIVLATSSEEEAERALDVIDHYEFDQQCFVGRPNPPLQYWLTDPG